MIVWGYIIWAAIIVFFVWLYFHNRLQRVLNDSPVIPEQEVTLRKIGKSASMRPVPTTEQEQQVNAWLKSMAEEDQWYEQDTTYVQGDKRVKRSDFANIEPPPLPTYGAVHPKRYEGLTEREWYEKHRHSKAPLPDILAPPRRIHPKALK